MKKAAMVFIFLACAGSLIGQYAYNDAKSLAPKKNVTLENNKAVITLPSQSIITLFKTYGLDENEKNNPFIKIVKNTKFSVGALEPLSTAPSGQTSGLSIPAVADAIAKFLVERVKEELAVAFFDNFAVKIKNNEILSGLFPCTADALAAMKEEIYKYSSYLGILREAMKADAKSLWDRFPAFLQRESVKNYVRDEIFHIAPGDFLKYNDAYDGIQNGLGLALYIVNGLATEVSAGQLLEDLPVDSLISRQGDLAGENVKTLLKLTQILSRSFRADDDEGNYWVSSDEIKKMLVDHSEEGQKVRLIYLGLLWQLIKLELPGIEGITDSAPMDIYKDILENRLVRRFGNAIGELELASKNIQDKIENSDDPKPSLGFAYADAYLKLCTSGFDLVDFVQEKIGASNAKALTVLDQMRRHTELGRSFLTSLKGLYIGVSQKEYGLALFNIVNIWNASMNFVIRESPPPSASALEPIRQSLSLTLFRYGSFIAAMANASDSDEMRKAIESVALPSGSYSVKRNSSFNVSLNAFVGLAPEWEWLSIRKEEGGFALNKNSRHGMLSVCAPIGIAVSHGCRSGASISLFASLIDPGALVAYRFTSLENQAPDFSLKNIFSPGLFFIWGLAHSPISLGLGTRLGPELRSITTDPQTGSLITDIRQKSWRILGMVSIDIPLLNFATR